MLFGNNLLYLRVFNYYKDTPLDKDSHVLIPTPKEIFVLKHKVFYNVGAYVRKYFF